MSTVLTLALALARFCLYVKNDSTVASRTGIKGYWDTLTDVAQIRQCVASGHGVAWLKDSVSVAEGKQLANTLSEKTGHSWTYSEPTPAQPATPVSKGVQAMPGRLSVRPNYEALGY